MDLLKLATDFTIEVTEYEKSVAKKAIIAFKHVEKKLDLALNHLNMIYSSFKDNPDVPPEDVLKARAALRRYRDKSIDNFNEFKIIAFKSLYIINIFGSDPEVNKLKKILIDEIESLESKVNNFVNLFDNLSSKEFTSNVIKQCKMILDSGDELKKIINDRVLEHIKKNILASSWADEVGQELKVNLDKPDAVIPKLVKERNEKENAVNNSISF